MYRPTSRTSKAPDGARVGIEPRGAGDTPAVVRVGLRTRAALRGVIKTSVNVRKRRRSTLSSHRHLLGESRGADRVLRAAQTPRDPLRRVLSRGARRERPIGCGAGEARRAQATVHSVLGADETWKTRLRHRKCQTAAGNTTTKTGRSNFGAGWSEVREYDLH